jgi:hypothetical protein
MDKYCNIKLYGRTNYEVCISLLIQTADRGKTIFKWPLIYTALPPEIVCEGKVRLHFIMPYNNRTYW